MIEASPQPWKGAVAGLAAGLVASYAMNRFQARLSRLGGQRPRRRAEPSNQRAADRASEICTGEPVPEADKKAAGQSVHYLVGAALGVGYGIAAELRPGVTRAFGSAFGSSISAVLDEGLVPALGFGAPPAKASLGSHLYGLTSHLAFGAAAEGTRRAVRRVLG